MKRRAAVWITVLFLFMIIQIPPAQAGQDSHVLINQVYGRADKTDAAISHSFIELYNPTDTTADLSGYSLQYAKTGAAWIKLDLAGVTMPAKTSFLIRCYSADGIASRYTITDYDVDWSVCQINNDAFKIALVSNQTLLITAAPTGENGVVDLVGAGTADYGEGAVIAGISKQKTARRIDFADTDNNSTDFEILDYRSSGISDQILAQAKPRYSGDGSWGISSGFPLTISAMGVTDNIVTGMDVQVTGTLSANARGIAAIYDKNNRLIGLDISSNKINPSAPAGVQSFIFSGRLSLGEGQILKSFVWEEGGDSILTMRPLAQSFYYPEGDGVIHLNGDSVDAAGVENVTVSGTVVTITAAGTYIIEGTLSDGQIVIRTPANKDDVELVLNGVNVSCSTSAPLFGANGRLKVSLSTGTVNTFIDAQTYVYPAGEDEPNACVFAKRDLTIGGDGALIVNGHFNNGIGSKDKLEINGGAVSVTAPNNAVKGNDSVTVHAAALTVTAGEDGIKSDSTDGAGYGVVDIQSGTVSITASQEAIQAVTAIHVSGGEVTANCLEDGINCQTGTVDISGGTLNITSGQDGIQAETALTVSGGSLTLKTGGGYNGNSTADSCKGLKGIGSVTVSGGTLSINAYDDAIHSDTAVTISSGSIDIWTADDGVHADVTATVQNDAAITIHTCYEGIEALTVNIAGGTIHVTASDDGINAAGGADQSNINPSPKPGGGPGQGGGVPGQGTGNGLITITGGYLVVGASGDGIDANGSITISGGTVIVNGPTSNGDAPVDYDGTFVMSGGFLVAAGSSGMAQAPGTSSTQRAVKITYNSTQAKNTLVTIKNASGNSILSFVPSKQYQSVVFCSPNLSAGQSYSIYSGGTNSGTVLDGLYSGGTQTGGTLKTSFTSSSVITNVTVN